MKKWLHIFLICCLALSLTACQSKKNNLTVDSPSPATISDETNSVPDNGELENKQESKTPIVDETLAQQPDSGNSIVYMTTDISPEGLMAVYEALGANPQGKIAVKIASGEPGSNYLRPELIGDFVQSFDDVALVECNTIYGRFRTSTSMH